MSTERRALIAKKACTRCSTQKRRCDRALPDCGLCRRLRQACIYDVSRLLSSGPTPSPSPRPEIFHSSGAFTPSHLQDAIIQRLGVLETENIISVYCREVEPWLPIISVSRLRHRLPLTWNEAPIDIALLCLSVVLLTTIPPSAPEDDNETSEFKNLYLFAKTSIASTEGLGLNSLLLIQSRILVTLFEVAHGIYPAAYISIGSIVRAADALNDHTVGDPLLQFDDDGNREETVLTWCGILVLDRYIVIDSRPQPSITSSRAQLIHELLKPSVCPIQKSHQDPTTTICRLARLIEASYLLDKVNTNLNSPAEEHAFSMDELILTIQTAVNLQTIIKEEIGDGVLLYSGGLALCNTALLLAFENGSKVPLLAGVTETCNSVATASLISTLAIILSTIEPFAFGTQEIDFNLLPPIAAFLVFKAAQLITERLLLDITSVESLKQLRALRSVLKMMSKRWLGCARYIKLLNEDTTPRILRAVDQV